MSVRVSTVVPVYNAEKFLKETVDSLLAQTWSNHEIVIVDDGSTDGSIKILDEYKSHPQVKLIVGGRKGGCAARNSGYRVATGEYVQFVDADDLLSTNKIEMQLEFLQNKSKKLLCSCGFSKFVTGGPPIESRSILWNTHPPANWLKLWLSTAAMMQTGVWLSHRDLFEAAGEWDENLEINQDGEFFARVVRHSTSVKFVDFNGVFYRIGQSNSVSKRNSEAKLRSDFRALELIESTCLSLCNDVEMRKSLADAFQRWLFEAYPFAKSERAICKEKVKLYGGSCIKPQGTGGFHFLKPLIGWRLAKRVERFAVSQGLGRHGLSQRLTRKDDKPNV